MKQYSWQKAVQVYRERPNNQESVRNNYFDLPVLDAAKRYANSEEFKEVLRVLGPCNNRKVLDIGAGHGIASLGFSMNSWEVISVDPDPSNEVGVGAIRELSSKGISSIAVVQGAGEKLPFCDGVFDVIFGRQVLHHASNLEDFVREAKRVLKPGGSMLFTREHVVDNEEQLRRFLNTHPLHHMFGGENAYTVIHYCSIFKNLGLEVVKMWGPLESILNYFPGTEEGRRQEMLRSAKRALFGIGYFLVWSKRFRNYHMKLRTRRNRSPGRLYSFLLEKSCVY